MGRISRKCYESCYFHVMTQGIKREFIYEKEEFKEKYINILMEAAKKTNVKILAYCLMDNHAHLLLYTQEIENLSKVMHITNTNYALYYNKVLERCGYVFRDRYRCESIYTERHLENCIKYIHNNPVVAGLCEKKCEYKYSTYNQYKNRNGIIDEEILKLSLYNDETDTDDTKMYGEFIDVDNEFGKDKGEDVNVVVRELVSKCDGSEITERELTFIGYEIMKRCKLKKTQVARKLGINRLKFTRMLQKYEL